jgi:ribosomal protein S18 acetylase RimI-like enzyme
MEKQPISARRILFVEPLNRDNRALAVRLAALHALCLPESSLTLMGARGIASAYRLMIRGNFEKIFAVVNADGAVSGGAVISFASGTLGRRLALDPSTAPFLALAFARLMLRSVRRAPQKVAGDTPPRPGAKNPELLSLFVAPGQRRSGLGRQLVAACTELVLSEGNESLAVYAPRDSKATIEFYQSQGFRDLGPANIRGQKLRLMGLSLPLAQPE